MSPIYVCLLGLSVCAFVVVVLLYTSRTKPRPTDTTDYASAAEQAQRFDRRMLSLLSKVRRFLFIVMVPSLIIAVTSIILAVTKLANLPIIGEVSGGIAVFCFTVLQASSEFYNSLQRSK